MASDAVGSLERAAAFWYSFELPGKRAQFDLEIAEMGLRQEASRAARVVLADRARDFRTLPDEERLKSFNGLMRAMQTELDALTARARAAEKSYLSLTASLTQAPDPGAALNAAVDAVRALPQAQEAAARLAADVARERARAGEGAADKDEELAAARRDVAALEEELLKLSNQDITIRQLEIKIGQVEGGIEAAVADRLAARESELRRVMEAELESLREMETAAEGRVSAALAHAAELSAQRDAAQASLATARERTDAEAAARLSEVDALSAEIERLRSAVGSSNASCEEMRRMLAVAVGGDAASGAPDPLSSLRAAVDAYAARAHAAEEEAARLSSAIVVREKESADAASALAEVRARAAAEVSSARASASASAASAAAAAEALAAAPSQSEVAELRATVAALQSLHFGGGGEGDAFLDESAEDPTAAPSGSPSGSTTAGAVVSGVMLRRVRQLEAKLMRAEAAAAAARADAAAARTEADAAREARDDASALAAQLEDALAGRLGTTTTADTGSGAAAQLADVLSKTGAMSEVSATALAVAAAAGEGADVGGVGGDGSAGLTLALRAQRDRFRARALALEAEQNSREAALTEANARVARLTDDNVKLFEKVRFLQYVAGGGSADEAGGGVGAAGAGGVRARGAAGSTVGSGDATGARAADDSDVDATYGALYAESMDPFAAYKHGEKARQYASLRRTDRIVLRSSSFLLASRHSRKAVFLYAVALHLLVLYFVWHQLHTEHDCGGPPGAVKGHHLRGLAD